MTSITSIARMAATQVSEMCQGSPPFSLLTKRYSRTAKEIRARPGMGQPRPTKHLAAQEAAAPGQRQGMVDFSIFLLYMLGAPPSATHRCGPAHSPACGELDGVG